jgi:arylsulfatase A-like enzyme
MRDLPAGRAAAPNILLLVLDTVRSYSLSVYGYPRPTTPALERVASEGVQFDRAFATSGWTLPSHMSMFTGRYADEVPTGPGLPIPENLPTLAGALREAGYATGGFVANLAYTTWEFGVARDFIHYEDYPVTPLTLITATSLGRKVFEAPKVRHFVGYVDDADRKNAARVQREFFGWLDDIGERPFFAFINYFDAHHPYLPPAPYNTRFGPPLPPRFRPFPLRYRQLEPEEIPLADNVYHGAINYIDDEIGKLVEELRTRGVLDNTLLIITSDHGEHLGDHELLSHGNSFYRQLLQVPLIVRYPAAFDQGQRIATPVSLRDLPATVLDVLQVPNGDRIPGVSLAGVVRDSTVVPSPVVSGRTLIGVAGAQSLISNGLHYIRMADGSEELYDMELDSLETNSIVATETGAAALPELRARLDSVNAAVPPITQ